jgi:LysM repeat protein
VAKGDTMSKIARKNHVTVEQLLAANPKIKNPNLIKVGDKVTIPVPEADGGASAAP